MIQDKSDQTSNTKLTKNNINQAYQNAKKNQITYQVLSTIFHTIKLSKQSNHNSNLSSQQINRNINNKFIPSNVVPPRNVPFLDPNAIYPLNKAGGFGVLIRTCSIVQKGVMEREGNNPPKLKEVIGFNNRIQTQKTKDNQKLQWIKQNKQYPFRIILKDNSNKIKGIYLKSKQQAQKIRIYYINKFSYKGNVNKIMQSSAKTYNGKLSQLFKIKLTIFKTQKKLEQERQRNRRSKQDKQLNNMNILDKSVNNDDQDKKVPSNNVPASNIKSLSQKGYSSDAMKSLIDKDKSRVSSISSNNNKLLVANIIKMQDNYKKNLFQKWVNKAHQYQQANKNNQPQEQMRNTKINSLQSKQKFVPASKNSTLRYINLQLLNQTNIFMKPIVKLSLYKSSSSQPQIQSKFNTILNKKQPNLSYQLIINNGTQIHQMKQNINQYQIGIKVIDYLTNSQICDDRILLKNKVLNGRTLLIDQQRNIRLQVLYEEKIREVKDRNIDFLDSPQGVFMDIRGIGQKYVEQIRLFWEKESVKRGYYNTSKDIKIIQIFQLSEQPPKFWQLGLSQTEYQLISLLNSASYILKFKLTQSFLPILKILQKIYSHIPELIQSCLSLILNYMHPYYHTSQFTRLNKLHTLLGLQGQLQLSSKIKLQMQLFKKIIKIQCPEFDLKMSDRNIGYVQLIYQYIYEMYSTNFKIKILLQLWNWIFKDVAMIPIYMLFIGVWLIKFYNNKLNKCNRFTEIIEVLNSKQTASAEVIIKQILILRQKYFNTNNNTNLIDSIKQMFNTKPLQQVIIEFYKRQTLKFDKRKQNRNIQKNLVLQKLSQEIQIQLPKYAPRMYTLHIYFYQLPPVSGSLYIKTNNIQYECLNLSHNRYFIISDVSTQITLQFINNKSEEFTSKLLCMQGINRYTVNLQTDKDSQAYKVQYICGLLTEGHIQILKKNRKFQHFIGSYMKQEDTFDQFLRNTNQCRFLNSFSRKLQKEDLGKKIKVVFSSGSKSFDEIQFYLRWISVSTITFPQKLNLIKQLSYNLSRQYFLSSCEQLTKILFTKFFEILQFPITADEIHSYYCDSVVSEFNSPRIIKFRLILPNGVEHKLQNVASNYLCNKAYSFLYQDIELNQLIKLVQKQLEQRGTTAISGLNQAVLNLVYSSFGEVKNLQIPIIKKKTGKDLVVDQSKFEFQTGQNDISMAQPEILATQVLPTFSKITTILDFVNNSKSIESLGKNRQTKNIPQSINLLKNCDAKYNKILLMRYSQHPKRLQIPFLNYYHDLISQPTPLKLPKKIFLNNLQTDLKTICTYKGLLQFTDNKRVQSTYLNKDLGIYGNFRVLPPKTQSIYFISILPQEQIKNNSQLFVNYGYGIYRWQPCLVLDKESNLKKETKPKKNYLVKYGRSQRLYRDFQLRIDPKVEQTLRQVQAKSSSSIKTSTIKKPAQATSSKRQLGTITKKNLYQSQSKRSIN